MIIRVTIDEKLRCIFLRKDIGDKIYSIIIMVLVFSIVYQTGFLITHSKETLPVVLANNSEEKEDVIKDSDVKLAATEVSSETNNTGVTQTAQTNESSVSDDSGGLNLFMYLLQQGMPYDNRKSDFSILNLVKYVTKLDISDPKTLISSQIPIIDNYEEDDLEITTEEQKEIYSLAASKPLNTDQVEVNNTSDKPLILLYSTHTTESYVSTKEKIDYSSYARSRNEKYNMLAVSNEIKKVLEQKYSLNVILDTTVHDYPSYETSYGNSLKTIKKNLEKYPSIKYVFDIHRDGLANNKKNIEKYATVANNVNSAKVMMVIGLNHENSAKNVAFSDKIYNTFSKLYPSLALPTLKRKTARYNQFASDNAVLFEVGSNLSTLEEAKASGKFLGDALGKVITENEVKKE